MFVHDTLPHDNATSYQVWLKTVEWFRRYSPDKTGHADRTDRRSDSNISRGGGGYKRQEGDESTPLKDRKLGALT